MEIWLWIVGGVLAGAVVGAAIVYLLMRRAQGDQETVRAVRQELDSYKEEVSEHFVNTAQLVNNLTHSYKAVYDHLEQGAYRLVDEEQLRKRLGGVEETEPVRIEYIGKRDPRAVLGSGAASGSATSGSAASGGAAARGAASDASPAGADKGDSNGNNAAAASGAAWTAAGTDSRQEPDAAAGEPGREETGLASDTEPEDRKTEVDEHLEPNDDGYLADHSIRPEHTDAPSPSEADETLPSDRHAQDERDYALGDDSDDVAKGDLAEDGVAEDDVAKDDRTVR